MVALKLLRHAALLLLLVSCASSAHPPTRLQLGGFAPGSRLGVAGSFNGWDPWRTPLREVEPGRFELDLKLPRGTHRIQLVLRRPDGSEEWFAPDGLERYEADGFGGRNGIIEVDQ